MAEVGDTIGEDIRERQKLERSMAGYGTVLPVFRIQPEEEMEIQDRWIKLTSKTLDTTNSFVFGHLSMAVLGTDKLGAVYTGTITHRVLQSGNVYREWFYDEQFEGTETTATWSTANANLVFASAQVGQSNIIYKNNQNINWVRLDADVSGTFQYQCASDGSTFETVSLETRHDFSTIGKELKWKITETAGSAGTVDSILIEIGV